MSILLSCAGYSVWSGGFCVIMVVHTLGYDFWGGGGRSVGVGFVVFGCFVDIKESLAGRGVGFVFTLAISAFQSGVGVGLSSCLAGRADMVACVVFTSTELAMPVQGQHLI